MTIATETKAKLPSKHEFAEVIHRLEAGGAMLPDTPENLMQIIGIYKAYAVPMDFYCATYFILPSVSFRSVLQILHPKEYLDLHNHYAGDDADLRIWREATAHPELLEFMEKGEPSKCPSCCTTGCMTESTWSLLKNVCGRCSGTAETWAGAI